MNKRSKTIMIFAAAVLFTAAVSVFVTLWFICPDNEFSLEEYVKYQEYKRLDDAGYILNSEEAAYLQALSLYYGNLLGLQDMIEKNFYKDTSGVDFQLGAAKGMVAQLDDPYSYFLSREEFGRLQESMSNEYVGIGVVVTPTEDGYITVVSPFKDSPAEKAGIRPLDRIIAVNGERLSGDQLSRAVELIRGEAGTEVTVTFMRDDLEFDLTLMRETIKVETVYSEVFENEVGYIAISQFGSSTGKEFASHLDELEKNSNVKGLIIDLRYNPGGELGALVDVADRLLGEQVIISLVNKQGEMEQYSSDEKNRYDKPLIVLVNEGSASASEALTGAVKDTGSGTIIGVTTFGKGVAQSLIPLEGGFALNLTTAEYFTPGGINVNEKGIEPDIIIENDPGSDEDEQLDKAIEVMKGIID